MHILFIEYSNQIKKYSQLQGSKYSYRIRIIVNIYLTHRWDLNGHYHPGVKIYAIVSDKITHTQPHNYANWLILTACQPIRSYSIPRIKKMAFMIRDFSQSYIVSFSNQVLKTQSILLFTNSRRENSWMITFSKGIIAVGNVDSLDQDLNSGHGANF